MSSRQRGRAFIDRNKAGILVTPANSSSGTSRAGHTQSIAQSDGYKFLPSLRSHYVDVLDMSKTVKSEARRTLVGWADTQGRRANMEDQIVVYGHDKFDLVAVFDGHNGPDVSIWAGHKIGDFFTKLWESGMEVGEALKEAFRLTNEDIRKNNVKGGSTGLVAVIMDDDIIVANVGDCRMITGKDGDSQRITKDHKPNDDEERARIERLGGEVTCTELPNGTVTYRVNGILAVARALGDFALEPHITAVPDIFHTNIQGEEEYIVIACDGIWDVLKDQEVVQICNAYWRDMKDTNDLEGAAGRLRNTAYSRHSTDNISVVVLRRIPYCPPSNNSDYSGPDSNYSPKSDSGPDSGSGPASELEQVTEIPATSLEASSRDVNADKASDSSSGSSHEADPTSSPEISPSSIADVSPSLKSEPGSAHDSKLDSESKV